MTLHEFWQIIDSSWRDAPHFNDIRIEALGSNDKTLLAEAGAALDGPVLESYRRRLFQLNKDELTSFIHHLEERLYNIDRQDVHEYTDGSDDGFLYSRCFIVGMGLSYYNMVDHDPSTATMDMDAEGFGFEAYGVYEELFGEEFDRYTHHSIESCSNSSKWQM